MLAAGTAGGCLGLGAETPNPYGRAEGMASSGAPAAVRRSERPDETGAPAQEARALLGKLPLYFIENRGQEDDRVAYYVEGSDTAVYFTRTGVTFALAGRTVESQAAPLAGERSGRPAVRPASLGTERAPRERWAVALDFLGARSVT